jgi:betaine-aldehyde dehydrogenase
MDVLKMFINGEWVTALSARVREIFDPANGERIAVVTEGNEDDTKLAIEAAYEAFKTWRSTNQVQRAAFLNKSADLIEAARADIAKVECLSTGKLLKTTLNDVANVCTIFRYYAGIIGTPSGETFNSMPDVFTMTVREPIGVCGLIIPWNSPVSIGSKCIAPALAAGNTIVVKPASIASLGLIKMFECMEQAGFPRGVINLVLGDGATVGREIGENPFVGKITFTGGTETGKDLVRSSSSNVKKLALELGGKSPVLVFDDADVDTAVNNIIFSLFNNAGQVCVAGSRVLVQEGIYEAFCNLLVERVRKIKVGMGEDPDAEMGPVISQVQMDKILEYIKCGQAEKARLVTGGHRITDGNFSKGFFIEPTVFVDCTNKMRIVREEIFGPVMVVGKFHTEDEAWDLANDTIYGLGAAVFTSDIGRAFRFTKQVKAACLWINTYFLSAGFDAPIYCLKQSGYSTLMGTACIESYMDTKQVSMRHTPTKFPWFRE